MADREQALPCVHEEYFRLCSPVCVEMLTIYIFMAAISTSQVRGPCIPHTYVWLYVWSIHQYHEIEFYHITLQLTSLGTGPCEGLVPNHAAS